MSEVLDAGCGGGVPVALYLSRRFMVTGVDLSDAQIQLARQNVSRARFVRKDTTGLDFPDEMFHAICSIYAIIHVPREEHGPLLENFHRMLRPGGLALLCMGAADWPGEVERFIDAPTYWSHYDAETNLRMTRGAGFEVLRWEIVPYGLDLDMGSKHLFVLERKRGRGITVEVHPRTE